LAEPRDQIDPLPASILLYRMYSPLLRALGVRFVIADGTLADPALQRVLTETGKAGATVNLYEIKGTNLGQFSPTKVTWAGDYSAAVAALREQQSDLESRVVLLGPSAREPELVSVSRSRLMAIRDGYHLSAVADGRAMVILPIQFSHCWQIENATGVASPQIVRANIVQTGVLFEGNADFRLRFNFEPWRASCRLDDVRDLSRFGFK
jgi:hypothetical protein